MLITAWVGMVLAPKPITWHWTSFITGLAGIGLIAASGGAMNHLAEISVDQKMQRTAQRPLAIGQLSKAEVWQFCVICILLGTGLLWQFNNLFSAILSILTMLGYGVFYTKWLKPRTSQNIVIGGLSGALPPLLGWVCVTGNVSAEPLILVLIIFTWTPPHFWALAINRINDYRQIDYPMLPVTHGIPYTSLSIILYTILMIISSQLPYIIGMNGIVYLTGVNLLNVLFFTDVLVLHQNPTGKRGFRLYSHSIIYLLLLFIFMFVDHLYPIDLVIY